MKFLSLLILCLLVSCGESPLLNHKMESSFKLSDSIALEGETFEFKHTKYSFSVDWTDVPKMGKNEFVMKTWNSINSTYNGPYQDPPMELNVFLWMPSMGHGSSPVKMKKLRNGEFKITDVYFIMGGKWELKFQLLLDGNVIDETVLNYNI